MHWPQFPRVLVTAASPPTSQGRCETPRKEEKQILCKVQLNQNSTAGWGGGRERGAALRNGNRIWHRLDLASRARHRKAHCSPCDLPTFHL